MPNPYASPSTDGSDRTDTLASSTLGRNRKRFLIAIHLASILLIIVMCVGGMVSYAPNVTRAEIQNIYLARMFWYGSGVVALQIVALFLMVRVK